LHVQAKSDYDAQNERIRERRVAA